MANIKAQIQNTNGDVILPVTKAAYVENNAGHDLGGVEAGAQVNVIESVTLNGSGGTITNKTLALSMTLPTISMVKKSTATTGYLATYALQVDGVDTGAAIDIPKDMVVQSGSIEVVTTADQPYTGAKVGDKYIDLVLANATNSHVYIPLSDIASAYTEGTGISISGSTISLNTSYMSTNYAAKSTAVTHTASTAVGSSTQPVYISSTGVATAIGHTIEADVPSGAVFTDTKNTAGSTNKASTKLYMIGASSQGANPQTYSLSTIFIDTEGNLNSNTPATGNNSTKVATTAFVASTISGLSIPTTTNSVTSGSTAALTSGGAYSNLVRRYSSSVATGSATQGVYVDANGQIKACTAVTSTYNASGTAPVNGQAIASALAGISGTDTLNTTGADNTSSKIFLVGATAQTSGDGSARTYSHDTAFVDTSGCLNSESPAASDNSTKVATTSWVKSQGFQTQAVSSVTQGTANGTISVAVNGGTATDVAVKGLGTAAYAASTSFAAYDHTHSEYAASTHSHGSNNITAMTGYTIASASSAISASDSLNVAIGKLEYKVDNSTGSAISYRVLS